MNLQSFLRKPTLPNHKYNPQVQYLFSHLPMCSQLSPQAFHSNMRCQTFSQLSRKSLKFTYLDQLCIEVFREIIENIPKNFAI